jgi:ring-1,2-phenylacetyl-CoA epoxidase subunit PaaD
VVNAAARSPAPTGYDDPVARARLVLAGVPDPEIPVLSLVDLGIIRSVAAGSDGALEVGVSPTYSGCPATAVIRADIVAALAAAGFPRVRVLDVLSPPWTSDWISDDGRRKLEAYGIAPPPAPVASVRALVTADANPRCPRCASADTELLSEFGSTPCKALHRCRACLEPFDRFKCI